MGSKTRTNANSPPTLMNPLFRNLPASNPFLRKITMDLYALRACLELSQKTLATYVLLLLLRAKITFSFNLPFN